MRTTYNRYILSLALFFMLTTVIISVSVGAPLSLYFSLYLLGTLALTILFAYLDPRARKGLEKVGFVFFAGFVVMVGIKALEIVLGRALLPS